jgi:hypothetical protein
MSLELSMLLVKRLASDYTVEPFGDGPPRRAQSHWEPAREFTVKLTPV